MPGRGEVCKRYLVVFFLLRSFVYLYVERNNFAKHRTESHLESCWSRRSWLSFVAILSEDYMKCDDKIPGQHISKIRHQDSMSLCAINPSPLLSVTQLWIVLSSHQQAPTPVRVPLEGVSRCPALCSPTGVGRQQNPERKKYRNLEIGWARLCCSQKHGFLLFSELIDAAWNWNDASATGASI